MNEQNIKVENETEEPEINTDYFIEKENIESHR